MYIDCIKYGHHVRDVAHRILKSHFEAERLPAVTILAISDTSSSRTCTIMKCQGKTHNIFCSIKT